MNNRKKKKISAAEGMAAARRSYKDTLFRMIFREPDALLSLYNAVNGTDYRNPEELQIVTLENAIYMNMKNDLAFIIDFRLSLYEHQASVNPNMPLRDLIYVAKEYQKLADKKSIYSSRQIMLPTPYFVVFYNGAAEQPERMERKLSEAYEMHTEEPALELRVVQLNIRAGYNRELLSKCPLLEQYSRYVERVQQYISEMPLNEAVERAVKECIRDGILAEFLQKYRAEAIEVSIFEYDEEKELALLREAEREAGREQGLEEGLKEGLKEGLEQGYQEAVVELVCKKLRKGRLPGKIAEELDVEEAVIRRICEAAAAFAPEYNSRKVCEAVRRAETGRSGRRN